MVAPTRKPVSYPWIPLESRWSANKALGELQSELPGQAVFHARVSGKDYRLAEALLLSHESEPFQRIKTFFVRGHLEKAREELASLGSQVDESDIELSLEKARLAAYDGEWDTCASFCHRAIAQNPPGITLLTFLQIRALAYYELGEYTRALRDLESMDSLHALYPFSPVYHYAKPLRIRLSARMGHIDQAWSQLKLAWKDAEKSEDLNLDQLLTLLRTEVDLRLFTQQDASRFAWASLWVAEALGDRLYAALARVELLRSGVVTKGLLQALEQDKCEYAKVRKLAQQYGLAGLTQNDVNSEEIGSVNTIFFREQDLLIHLKPFSAHVLSKRERLSQVVLALSSGPLKKEDLFKAAWGISKYVPHLHENTIDQTLSRVRKKYGLKLEREPRGIKLEDFMTVV